MGIMSSLHKCNFFQPIILKPQQDSSGPIFTFMSGLCTLPLIFASLEQQKSGKSLYWCFWKGCIKMRERGRNRKYINAGYGACVPSMIPHYTQIMQSPSLLHAAALRTNKTTSGTTQNLTKTQKHKYTNTPVHSIYLLDMQKLNQRYQQVNCKFKYFWEYISGIHLNTCPIYQKKWALKSKNLHCDIEICPEFSIRVCVKFAVWHLARRCGYYTSWSAGGEAKIEN